MSGWYMLFDSYEEAAECLPSFESEEAKALLADAEESIRKERESFERSDTDGCVSQWCHSIHANELQREAELANHGRLIVHPVLIDVESGEIVSSYMVLAPSHFRPWVSEFKWHVRRDNPALKQYRGVEYVSNYKSDAKFAALGLRKVWALVPAKMAAKGPGDRMPEARGLSGLASYRGKFAHVDLEASGLPH